MRTRVKICCIADRTEARRAYEQGADALGLVSRMPSGPGVIGEEIAADVAASTPPPIATFLLTPERTADRIAAQLDVVRPTVVQIVDYVEVSELTRLADIRPGVRRIQVVHVEGREALELIDVYSPHVHAFLLDSGRPSAATPVFGGTGQTHDWDVSRAFVDRSPLPVFLAGGLRPENVAEAIRVVRPYGVDVCSGVRAHGSLSTEMASAFMRAVVTADSTRP